MKPNTKTLAALMATTTLLFPMLAMAAQQAFPWANLSRARFTGTAGLDGQPARSVRGGTDATRTEALKDVSFLVANNAPCAVRVGVATATRDGGPSGRENRDWEALRGVCRRESGRSGATTHSVRVGNAFVRGVQVCTNRADRDGARSVRGLRLMTAQVGANGLLQRVAEPMERTWDGCQEWHEARYCPDTSIATDLVAVQHPSDRANYRGVRLVCSPLENPDGPHAWATRYPQTVSR